MTNNIFVNAVQTAAARRWCMRPGCTTCGATEYRAALARVAGPLGGLLCDALCDLDPADLMVIPEWDGALQIAMRHLPVSLKFQR